MLGSMASFLRFLFGFGAQAVEPDGFGQSILQDIRFVRNFRMCRRTPVVWHIPATEEARALDVDLLIGRFGDMTIGIAQVAGRRGFRSVAATVAMAAGMGKSGYLPVDSDWWRRRTNGPRLLASDTFRLRKLHPAGFFVGDAASS